MPKIPEPSTLIEIAKSTKRYVNDREWKKYQRYLAKRNIKNDETESGNLLSFEEFCRLLTKSDVNP